jgi:hypothetical protein
MLVNYVCSSNGAAGLPGTIERPQAAGNDKELN